MPKPKLTPWFPGTVKPASGAEHIGPYLRKYYDGNFYSWWDGRRWMFGPGDTPDQAWKDQGESPSQALRWRDLAEKP